MTTSQKIDFLYSKFVLPDRAQTSVFNSQIWTHGDEIPQTLPTLDPNGVYTSPSGNAILKMVEFEKMDLIPGFQNAFSSANVYDVISSTNGFDETYAYEFYTRSSSGDYVRIPFGDGDYFFDHDTGILFFPSGRPLNYNSNGLYITFIQYIGSKGIDGSSQFPGTPQSGAVGPTGPTGPTGQTGPVDEFSLRYVGQWNSLSIYSKWNIVKYNGMFFISTINSNSYTPINGTFWQAFGIPQLSTTFDTPGQTYWLSPSFTPGNGRFSNIDDIFADINSGSFSDASIIIYPGIYEMNNNIVVRPGVNINFFMYGRIDLQFIDDTRSILFSQGSKIEIRGFDFSITNGSIRLNGSSLSIFGGTVQRIQMSTSDLSNTSRLMITDSELGELYAYGSFALICRTNIINKITMDEVSVVHIEDSMIQARPDTDPSQEKIEVVSVSTSGTPPGFGYQNPCLLFKNSRVLSNSAVIRCTFVPGHGFQLGMISSCLYVKDSSTSFLDITDPIDAFVLGTVVNTSYNETNLNILNQNGGFQTIEANFED